MGKAENSCYRAFWRAVFERLAGKRREKACTHSLQQVPGASVSRLEACRVDSLAEHGLRSPTGELHGMNAFAAPCRRTRQTCSERVPVEVFAVLEQLTLIEAGQVLGISPDAVRMRIKRGSMQAEKGEDGRWLVWVDTEQAAAEREVEREAKQAEEREPEREGELSAEALRARIGILEARLEAVESERDFLRKQVDTLIFAQAMQTQKALPNPERRSWWARLWGR
jgi:hypothetical protein